VTTPLDPISVDLHATYRVAAYDAAFAANADALPNDPQRRAEIAKRVTHTVALYVRHWPEFIKTERIKEWAAGGSGQPFGLAIPAMAAAIQVYVDAQARGCTCGCGYPFDEH
jgi:hypothetical protein